MLEVKIITPSKVFLDAPKVEYVQLPGAKGQLGIYPDHADFITTLSEGVVRYKEAGSQKEEALAVGWGYLQIKSGKASLLLDRVASPSDVSADECKKALKDLNEQLDSGELSEEKRNQVNKDIVWQESQLSLLS